MDTFPHLHLLVSGGNSQIIWVKNWQNWQIVGQTQDDAAGECLDKIGRMLGLDYPGGVWLSRIAGLENKNLTDFPISNLSQKLTDEKIAEIQNKNHTKTPQNITQNENLQNNFQVSNLNQSNNSLVKNFEKDGEKVLRDEKLSENVKTTKTKIPKIRKQNSFLANPDQNLVEISLENNEKKSKESSPFQLGKNYNYSFSGLKTAVRYFLQKQKFENWTFEQKLTKLETETLLNWQTIQTFLANFELLDKRENSKIDSQNLEIQAKVKNEEIESGKLPKNGLCEIENLETKIREIITKMVEKNLISTTKMVDFRGIIQSQNLEKLELFWQMCVSAQFAVVSQLTRTFELAINDLKPSSLGLSGGVSANLLLRSQMTKLTEKYKMEKFYLPPLKLAGDNAVMIALTGIADLWSQKFPS